MIGLSSWATQQPGRCTACGYHERTQGHSPRCDRALKVAPDDKATAYARFKAVLIAAAGVDGLIHMEHVRPKVEDIPAKWKGQFVQKAKHEGLISFAGKEPSTDLAGGNGDKDQKVWKLERAA